MTREEAIEILSELHAQCCDADSIFNTLDSASRCVAIDMAIDALSDVPDIRVGKWVPCSEMLPAENGNYLVTAIWKGKLEVDMDYFQFGCMWDDYRDNVIAWMPLPEPYREEQA